MELNNSFRHYIAANTGDTIKELCSPLRSLGINFFSYMKAYKQGGHFWVCSDGDWSEHFYRRQYHQYSTFENLKVYQPSKGVYLWNLLDFDSIYCADIFLDARDLFNIDNGVTIVDETYDAYEFWHYASSRDNRQVNNVYVNHSDLLRRFGAHFKERSASLLERARTHMAVLPQTCPAMPEKKSTGQFFQMDDFLASTPLQRLPVDKDNPTTYLTQREIETAQWLVKGKSAAEIGLLTHTSKRTVESHINSIKSKLSCFKQCRLGYRLGKLGILDVDFE